MRLVAERIRLAGEVGETKRHLGLPVRNYGTEAEVLARYREAAAAAGLDGEFAEAVAGLMIGAAVRHQEERAWRAPLTTARSIVLVGGAGRMGRWFQRFFEGQGHRVSIRDPKADPAEVVVATESDVTSADLVMVATSLGATPAVLHGVIEQAPRGLVVDIASLKSHLLETFATARERGVRMASLHPLFGPDVRTLGGRVVAVCDCGDPAAAEEAASLFADTAATVTRIPVEDHDRYMQVVLGLSHLISLLFATTVARAGLEPADLSAMAGTTWLKQLRTASEVVREDPQLYYEIQHLNDHSAELYALVRDRLTALEVAASSPDPGAFTALMEGARAVLPATPGPLLA
jgi:chorismate mutase/prephenate dehydrogenase